MKGGRSHGGILGVWGRGSQTMLGCLEVILHLNGHALLVLECLLRRSFSGKRNQVIKRQGFVRQFGSSMLDEFSESAENTGRAFSVSVHILKGVSYGEEQNCSRNSEEAYRCVHFKTQYGPRSTRSA